MNRMLKFANYCADHTVFIASWLKDLNLSEIDKSSSVILNGGDNDIFFARNYNKWDKKDH